MDCAWASAVGPGVTTWPVDCQPRPDTAVGIAHDHVESVPFDCDDRLRLEVGAGLPRAPKVPKALLAHGERNCRCAQIPCVKEVLNHAHGDRDRRRVVAHPRPDEPVAVALDGERCCRREHGVDVRGDQQTWTFTPPRPDQIPDRVSMALAGGVSQPLDQPFQPWLLSKRRAGDQRDPRDLGKQRLRISISHFRRGRRRGRVDWQPGRSGRDRPRPPIGETGRPARGCPELRPGRPERRATKSHRLQRAPQPRHRNLRSGWPRARPSVELFVRATPAPHRSPVG